MTQRIDSLLDGAGLPRLERSAWVEVDVGVLAENARALIELVAPSTLAPVVKADGYGHGLEAAARCAVSAGAARLCVADSGEARRLRVDGYEGPIFVLYPVPAAVVPHMAELAVDTTVGSTKEARDLDSVLGVGKPPLSVHLEIDTGMTRGGVAPEEAITAASALANSTSARLTGVWTHLSTPEDPDFTEQQLGRFDSVLSRLRAAGIDPGLTHAAASGGLLSVDTSSHSFVRSGLSFYGLDPHAGDPLPQSVRPALTVKAHPVRLTEVPSGARVGYAGTWTAERDSTIATLPIGYADGWSRASSPGTFALVEGRRAPLVGRVSSDSITVDVTGLDDVGPRAEFTLLGPDAGDEITADEVAAVRGTISWEVLQQLGSRLTRVYTRRGGAVALRAESTTEVVIASAAGFPFY